jgi:hypothetical protein
LVFLNENDNNSLLEFYDEAVYFSAASVNIY